MTASVQLLSDKTISITITSTIANQCRLPQHTEDALLKSHRRLCLVLVLTISALAAGTTSLHAQFQPQPPVGPNFQQPNFPPVQNPPIMNPPAFDPQFGGPDFPPGPAVDFDFPFPPAFMPPQVQPEDSNHVWVYVVLAILGGMFLIAVVTLVVCKACGAF